MRFSCIETSNIMVRHQQRHTMPTRTSYVLVVTLIYVVSPTFAYYYGDGTDGSNCTSSEFPCSSGDQCVPLSYECDGYENCNDGSDEWFCPGNKTTRRPPQTTYYPPTARPSPQPSQCKDLKDTCVEWVYRGYCTNPEYETYMTVYCRKSCNMCTGASAAMNNQGDPCIPVRCSHKHRSVCGSDNVTYWNDCYLINARKCGEKVIMIKHLGRCKQSRGCGIIKPRPMARVLGGNETSIEQNPWLVQILVGREDDIPFQFSCGGSIISSTYILTAAHCLQIDLETDPMQRWPHFMLRVVVGLSERHNSTHKEKYPLLEVENSFMHPLYINNVIHEVAKNRVSGSRFDYDIALLKLKTPLELNDDLPPVCLPDQGAETDTFVGDDCKIAGWGLTDYNEKPKVVRQISSDIIDEQSCTEYLSKHRNKECKHHYNCRHTLCADNPEVPGESACSGDSGSPLVCRKGNRWVQAGVTSHVASKNLTGQFACNENVGDHTMYTNVPSFMGWINSVMIDAKVQCLDTQFACKDGSGCVNTYHTKISLNGEARSVHMCDKSLGLSIKGDPVPMCPDYSDRDYCRMLFPRRPN